MVPKLRNSFSDIFHCLLSLPSVNSCRLFHLIKHSVTDLPLLPILIFCFPFSVFILAVLNVCNGFQYLFNCTFNPLSKWNGGKLCWFWTKLLWSHSTKNGIFYAICIGVNITLFLNHNILILDLFFKLLFISNISILSLQRTAQGSSQNKSKTKAYDH